MSPKSPQEDDNDLPAHLLADYDSQFVDVKGLVVHYKFIDGSAFSQIPLGNSYEAHEVSQYTRSSSKNSPSYSSIRNPLIWTSISGPLHTPLLSGYAGENNFSTSRSSSWSNAGPALNGWPAIMQQTHNAPVVMPSTPTSNVNNDFHGKKSAVVFIHGFGGGVFSWRHVMGTVAREVGCMVVAFDRPGWGLTTRPRRTEWEPKGLPNPYELQTQVFKLLLVNAAYSSLTRNVPSDLNLESRPRFLRNISFCIQVELLNAFCKELGLTSVILVGHSDGGLLALMAAAQSSKSRDSTQV